MRTQTERTEISKQLVAQFEARRRAELNADLRSRVAIQQLEDNAKLTETERDSELRTAKECALDANMNGVKAVILDAVHNYLYRKPAKTVLRTQILAERRALERKNRKLSAKVDGGSDEQKLLWTNLQFALALVDTRMELVQK